jgi:Icc-related predicted phosphoesterase
MKINVTSDLHFEFHKDKGHGFIRNMYTTDVDVLVLAGDVSQHYWVRNHVKELCDKFPQVVYVAGNHEFYASSFKQMRHILNTLDNGIDNFHFLDNRTVTINGQRFVGTTMWFPDGPMNFMYQGALNDFTWIKEFHNLVYEENKKAVKFLSSTVQSSDIVVSHHLPSHGCVDAMYRNGLRSALNIFYVCDMTDLILNKQPKLWCHGHSHQHQDIVIGNTRVVRNPFGYPSESSGYNDKFIIEV